MKNHLGYEVGRFYSVPTVRGKVCGVEICWPVLGPKHEDRELIGFPHEHYHIDFRFLSASFFRRVFSRRRNFVYATVLHEGIANEKLPAPVMRRRKCSRTIESLGGYPQAPWLHELEAAYATSKMSKMICPHRGLPLTGCEQHGDVITCPGHGLRWNMITGALVRATPWEAIVKEVTNG